MECREAEELYAPYLLGALDSKEKGLMDSHLDTCQACRLNLQEEGEAAVMLALAVPQLEVPERVKQRLLSRVESELRPGVPAQMSRALADLWAGLVGAFASHTGKAVAGVLVAGLVLGGLWFNARLTDVSDDLTEVAQVNEVLNQQLEAAAEREAQVMKTVRDQLEVTYEAVRMSATPGSSVNMLWGTGGSRARGMVVVSPAGVRGLLIVLDLLPPPPDKEYKVWLITNGQRHDAGVFTVDNTGFGQTVIIPVSPFAEFDAIGITMEPTGTSVLRGDL